MWSTYGSHEVVIARGGPTGLMLAGELALARVDVANVERRETKTSPVCARGVYTHARSKYSISGELLIDLFRQGR